MSFKHKLMRTIRRLYSDNKLVYKLYFHLFRKWRGMKPAYFSKKTDLYFDGFPRSGNTYYEHIIIRVLPDKKFVHHLHKIAPIKIALTKQIPVLILIRDPENTISSYYLKYYSDRKKDIPDKVNYDLLKRIVEDYFFYYKFLSNVKSKIMIFSFNYFIRNEDEVVISTLDLLGENYDRNKIIDKVFESKKSYTGATSTFGSSRPNRQKEIAKKQIIEKMKTQPKYADCVTFYHSILPESKKLET